MAQIKTDELIRITAKQLFAKYGYDGVSMRILAKESGVGLSSIYHFFEDKDILLKDVYAKTNKTLGIERADLPNQPTAESMLAQLIDFQFQHIEDIVYVLKYYLHYRQDFAALSTRTLPPKSVQHVEEVLHKGLETGEFNVRESEIGSKAKVIAHTINGYLLEYYPDVPDQNELKEIVSDIVTFSVAGLK
jgi:AcrR family transcriptional regulator